MRAAKAPTRATTLPAARPEAPPVYGTGPVGVAVGAVQVLVPLLLLGGRPLEAVPVAEVVLLRVTGLVTGLVITDVMTVVLVLVTGVEVVMTVVEPLVVEV